MSIDVAEWDWEQLKIEYYLDLVRIALRDHAYEYDELVNDVAEIAVGALLRHLD